MDNNDINMARCESNYLEPPSFSDKFCDDPGCTGQEDEQECDCGATVCQKCRKECDCCGEAFGCAQCFTRDSEAEWICDECLRECECSYTAGYKRFAGGCPYCGREVK